MTKEKPTGQVRTYLKDSGTRSQFETGAVRDAQTGKGRMDLLPVRALVELSKLFEEGCNKYGDRNWEKGIPLHRYMDSGLRHALKFLRGDRDEKHLIQAAWNFVCLIDTLERIREGALPDSLDTLPAKPSWWDRPVAASSVGNSATGADVLPTKHHTDADPLFYSRIGCGTACNCRLCSEERTVGNSATVSDAPAWTRPTEERNM